MSLVIEGLSLPKKEDGSYWVPSWEVPGVQICHVQLSLMLDQETNTLEVWTSQYAQDLLKLQAKYKVIETKEVTT